MKSKTKKISIKSGSKRKISVKRKVKTRKINVGPVISGFSLLCFFGFLFVVLLLLNLLGSKKQTIESKVNVSKAIASESAELVDKVLKTPTPTVSERQELMDLKSLPPTAPPTSPNDFCVHVPVLMYHHIQPQGDAVTKKETALSVDSSIFDSQMQYLQQNGYTSIWSNELIEDLISKKQPSPKTVVITMDDGYADNYNFALPVLQKYGFKANLMLASGLVGNSDMLSWDQISGLKNSGLIYFTNHTWSHYALTQGTQDKIESEIDIAQSEIQNATGQSVNVFTYPYGSFDNNAFATLARKNYIGAFSTIPGQDQCDSFIMSLHRTRIGNDQLSVYGL